MTAPIGASNKSRLLSLPPEVQAEVIKHLGAKDAFNFALTSKDALALVAAEGTAIPYMKHQLSMPAQSARALRTSFGLTSGPATTSHQIKSATKLLTAVAFEDAPEYNVELLLNNNAETKHGWQVQLTDESMNFRGPDMVQKSIALEPGYQGNRVRWLPVGGQILFWTTEGREAVRAWRAGSEVKAWRLDASIRGTWNPMGPGVWWKLPDDGSTSTKGLTVRTTYRAPSACDVEQSQFLYYY